MIMITIVMIPVISLSPAGKRSKIDDEAEDATGPTKASVSTADGAAEGAGRAGGGDDSAREGAMPAQDAGTLSEGARARGAGLPPRSRRARGRDRKEKGSRARSSSRSRMTVFSKVRRAAMGPSLTMGNRDRAGSNATSGPGSKERVPVDECSVWIACGADGEVSRSRIVWRARGYDASHRGDSRLFGGWNRRHSP